MTNRANNNFIRIYGIYKNTADVVTISQPNVLPSFSFVVAFQQANSRIRGTGSIHFTRANPNGSVFPIYRHATYVLRWAVIHYRRERCAVIIGVPKSAAGVAYIKFGWIVWVNGKIYNAAAHNCGTNTFES